MSGERQANVGLVLGMLSLILIPVAYAWIPSAGHNPDWMGFLVPAGEWGGLACAVAAIWLGTRARRSDSTSRAAIWARRLGGTTVTFHFLAFVAAAILYR